jgi:hypothetical protein
MRRCTHASPVEVVCTGGGDRLGRGCGRGATRSRSHRRQPHAACDHEARVRRLHGAGRLDSRVRDWSAPWRIPAPFQPTGFLRDTLPESLPRHPGEVALSLDTRGNLIELLVVPPIDTDPEAAELPVDWAKLLVEMGLDAEAFESVAPRLTPPVHADARAAWRGSYPESPSVPIRIEAAAHSGKVVSVRSVGSWNPGGGSQDLTWANTIMRAAAPLHFLMLVGGLVFAGRNLRLGRGDRRGAFRGQRYGPRGWFGSATSPSSPMPGGIGPRR